MRILVLGGTSFLGRHFAEAALARGHELTLFNRGRTNPWLFPEAERLVGDRDGDLEALRGRSFDAVLDTSGYVPRIVRETIDALGEVGHYTFVSSVSAYADLSTPPTEGSATAVDEEYGGLKAACEEVVREHFPAAFVVRPGLIVGPWDPTGRFTYWPLRLADGGRVLAPAPPGAPAQVIDARDLAAWLLHGAEEGLAGTYNAVDRPTTRAALLAACGDAELVWVPGDFLAANDVEEWMELPLWLHSPDYAGMLAVDPAKAFAAGLATRPLEQTACDTLAWARTQPGDWPAGLDREKERRVLDAWRSKQ